MRDDRGSSTEPSPENDGDRIEDALAGYIDRLNTGERISPDEVHFDHPTLGPEIVERLRAFAAAGGAIADGLPGTHASGETAPLGALGDYKLRRQIGRGGMGVVYEAWQNSMDRRVALKVMPRAVAADTKAVARFIQEAQLAGKLSHPNIVHVHGMGVEEQVPYFAMEYVDGETLAQVLARIKDAAPDTDTPFGKKESVVYFGRLADAFADVADGLQHAHSKKVIHRDIKPSNLILDREGRLRILDFGLARQEGQESLTISGDFLGTPQYMSPEQARRRKIPVDHRTDVYSLGATMYEVLCGRPPFRGKDHADTLSQILERSPVEPRKINRHVPNDIQTIVLKCLRKEAGDRYGTSEAMAQDLHRFVRGDAIEARPPSAWEELCRRVRASRRAIIVGLVLAAFAVLAGGLYLRAREESRLRALAEYEPRMLAHVLGMLCAQLPVHIDAGLPASPMMFRDMASEWYRRRLKEARRQDLIETVDALERIAAQVPRPEACYFRARCLNLLERPREALSELEQALERDPRFAPAAVLRAQLLETAGRLTAGQSEIRPAEASDPWERAWSAARSAEKTKRWKDAAQAYGAIIELASSGRSYLGTTLEAHLGRGLALLEARECAGAIEDFAVVRSLAPGFLDAVLLLGKAYWLKGDPEEAEQRFLEFHGAIRQLDAGASPNQPPAPASERDLAALWIALLHVRLLEDATALRWAARIVSEQLREEVKLHVFIVQARYTEAIESGRIAVGLAPRDAFACILLGEALSNVILGLRGPLRAKLVGELGCVAEKAVSLEPESAEARAVQGAALFFAGDTRGAQEACERAVRLDRRSAFAQRNLAALFLFTGPREEGLARLRHALDLAPDASGILNFLGSELDGLGRTEEARAHFERALRVHPRNGFSHGLLGRILAREGRYEEAMACFERSIELLPRDSGAHVDLAGLFRAKGQLGEALREARLAVEVQPHSPTPRALLAEILEELQGFAEAAGEYALAIELDPASDSSRQGLLRVLGALGPDSSVLVLERLGAVLERIEDADFRRVVEAARGRLLPGSAPRS